MSQDQTFAVTIELRGPKPSVPGDPSTSKRAEILEWDLTTDTRGLNGLVKRLSSKLPEGAHHSVTRGKVSVRQKEPLSQQRIFLINKFVADARREAN